MSSAGSGPPAKTVEECLYLAGHVGLAEFLGFVANQASSGQFDDPRKWTEEWNAASAHFRALERSEAGLADGGSIVGLPDQVAPLQQKVLASPQFRRAFPVLPTQLGVVELERLIVCQPYVSLDRVRRIQEELPAPLTPENIFELCIPFEQKCPPVRQHKQGSNSWVFMSPAHAIRVVETLMTDVPSDYQSRGGPTLGLCGAVIGFPSQYINVIQAGSRLILNNGTHRALALLQKGVTRVPCVVQRAGTLDELLVVAMPEVIQNAAHFLQVPRPPLLRDFLDPKISRHLPVPRTQKCLKVTIETELVEIPDGE